MHTLACTKSWVPSLALQKLDAGAHTCTPSAQEMSKEEQKGYPSLHSQMGDSLKQLGNPSWRNREGGKKKIEKRGRRENKEKKTLNSYYFSGYFP